MKYKIHRCNCREIWSVQNRKTKFTVSSLLLNGKWIAELKPERRCNPKGFVTTNSSDDLIFNPAIELVEQFIKVEKLIYDKQTVNFNVKHGTYLYFAEDGTCHILIKK
ncbi:hypothetical protein NDK43_09780 [Neobacillus pocheonensis]|uniref:Uncharacterized protein n=1 Tax=Neobacillus pocheonensis TaxID=363869 RepID=A0ABT0W8G9_9BACI|nr:hypothetical protein [Neobacillus pocheonensis]